jgi:hypothetical protein
MAALLSSSPTITLLMSLRDIAAVTVKTNARHVAWDPAAISAHACGKPE